MPTAEHEPCPWCNENIELRPAKVDPSHMGDCAIFCPTCGAQGPVTEGYEKAWDAWDERL